MEQTQEHEVLAILDIEATMWMHDIAALMCDVANRADGRPVTSASNGDAIVIGVGVTVDDIP